MDLTVANLRGREIGSCQFPARRECEQPGPCQRNDQSQFPTCVHHFGLTGRFRFSSSIRSQRSPAYMCHVSGPDYNASFVEFVGITKVNTMGVGEDTRRAATWAANSSGVRYPSAQAWVAQSAAFAVCGFSNCGTPLRQPRIHSKLRNVCATPSLKSPE